jgi:acetylglutamate kinase
MNGLERTARLPKQELDSGTRQGPPMTPLAGRTFIVRIDRASLEATTLPGDLAFLMQRKVRPIVVAPTIDAARSSVRTLNRRANVAVGLSGADAAFLPAAGKDALGRVQTHILSTLTSAGYIPIIEPTALGLLGDDIDLAADDVAAAIASATEAARVLFFHEAGGVVDPDTTTLIDELTPAEALALADRTDLAPELRRAIRAAALGVRAGVEAAQILDGRIAHAAIVEFLTERHLGTQVTGTVYLGAA